jgi:K+/H+ antiporter YhaU regulatory subunit KhtT
VGENKIVTASPIKDVDKIVSQQFLHINWKEWKEPSDFKRITIPAAQNISHLIRKLKIDESNDALINDLSDLMERYQKWVDSIAIKPSATDKTPPRISDVIADRQEQDLSNICTIISEQITNYRKQREAQEPIKALLAAIDTEKNRWESRGWFHISFAGQLQTSGLEGYLRRGNEGFLEDYELGTAERILKLTDGQLKQQANFLSDPEFALMKRRFDKLKQELPKIKADIHKIEVGAAKIALSDPR